VWGRRKEEEDGSSGICSEFQTRTKVRAKDLSFVTNKKSFLRAQVQLWEQIPKEPRRFQLFSTATK
jgi:hypothetical protein